MAYATSGHWLASVPAISKPPGILPHQFQSALRHWNYLAYVDLALQLLYPGSVVQRAQWQREASTQDQKISNLIAVVLWHSCWSSSCLLTITRPPSTSISHESRLPCYMHSQLYNIHFQLSWNLPWLDRLPILHHPRQLCQHSGPRQLQLVLPPVHLYVSCQRTNLL